MAPIAFGTADLDELLSVEMKEQGVGDRHRQPKLVGNPFRGAVRVGGNRLERQVRQESEIELGVLDALGNGWHQVRRGGRGYPIRRLHPVFIDESSGLVNSTVCLEHTP